ncbi:MAG: AAA family ATPase [Pseudomonadota bacterium]
MAFADDFWVIDWEMIGAVATVLALIVAYIGLLQQFHKLSSKIDEAQKARETVERLRGIATGGRHSVWSQPLDLSAYWPAIEASPPAIMFGHLKGGVGKTTVAANLAAAFVKQGKRVLAIDLDYQGSLSSLFLGHAGIADENLFKEAQTRSGNLLDERRDATYLLSVAREVDNAELARLRFISSSYLLADVENRLTLRWMMGETPNGVDPRLYLARLLWTEEVREAFDLVIIDTAPRLTFAFINGLCAATHIVTPTIMDGMSAISVNDMFEQLKHLKRRLSLPFDVAGVVPNRTWNSVGLTAREQRAAALIRDDALKTLGRNDILFDDAIIGRNIEIQEAAGSKLAYFQAEGVQPMFDRLAAKLSERIRIP